MKKHSSQNGFSLVELLTVICIIALLASFSVGAIKRSSASLTAEGNFVADLASLAQQNAFSKNRVTALAFAHTNTGEQGFAVFELPPRNDGHDPEVGDWRQVTPWRFLSAGIALQYNAAVNTFVTKTPTISPALSIGTIGSRGVQKFAYQIFLPTSQLAGGDATGSSFPTLRLQEGAYQGQQFIALNGQGSNYYDILINPATGRTIIERP